MTEFPKIINWIRTTSEYFNNLEIKNPNAMYLLTDTLEIYNGNNKYCTDLEFVDTFPENPIINKLYFKPNTGEGKSWNGYEWKVVIPKLNGSLQDGVECDGVVTGEGIKEYVTDKIKNIGNTNSSVSDKVTLSKSIHVKGQSIGSLHDGDILKEGETLTSVLTKILSKRIPPTYFPAKITMNLSNQTLEAGSYASPTITSIFYQNDAGPLSTYKVIKEVNGHVDVLLDKGIVEPYKVDRFQVTEENNIKFTTAVIYSKGRIKNDNLDQPDPDNRIPAGAVTTSINYKAARKLFFGASDQVKELNNDTIRSLNSSVLGFANGSNSISVSKGTSQIIIAYPESLPDITSIISSALNLNVLGTFKKSVMEVSGANNYKPIRYKVYEYKPAIPFVTADIFTFTI